MSNNHGIGQLVSVTLNIGHSAKIEYKKSLTFGVFLRYVLLIFVQMEDPSLWSDLLGYSDRVMFVASKTKHVFIELSCFEYVTPFPLVGSKFRVVLILLSNHFYNSFYCNFFPNSRNCYMVVHIFELMWISVTWTVMLVCKYGKC